MRKRPCWRLNPDEALHHAVEALAKAEARTVSQTLFVLVRESVAARRAVDRNLDRIVEAFRAGAVSEYNDQLVG
jgi:hypothetical protein